MDLGADRCHGFLASRARCEVIEVIEPALEARLRHVRLPCTEPVILEWTTCFNCEA